MKSSPILYPSNKNTLKALKRSPLGLDVYFRWCSVPSRFRGRNGSPGVSCTTSSVHTRTRPAIQLLSATTNGGFYES